MESRPEDASLSAPLIVDENTHKDKLQDSESFYHNSTKTGASSFKTIVNGLNALSGVGILSTPYALASGGWLSLILLFIIASAAFYSGLLIKRCMEADSHITTYPDIGQKAFGNKGRILISVFMCTELYLVAVGFLILEGDNLHNLFPNVDIVNIGGKKSFILIVALVILPTVWLDNLIILSYVSASGVLASAIIIASIFWAGAVDGVGFKQKGKLINWNGIPNAVSLYGFCYCAHPVFPALYTSMKKKHQFSNVLLICFIVCTLSYASMAVIGYLMFGSDVESQITLNLPTKTLSSKIAIYTTLVNPIAKYALMITPIVNATKNWFPCISSNKKKPLNMFMSSALLLSTVIVALALPFFGDLMSLVGAFLSVTASIIIPCLCYLKISGIYGRFSCELVLIGGIVVLGVMAVIFGTYTSVLQIVGHL
ncbi:amino acid transporter AVT1I-like [Euphorbia lathyris]|uniref:amino acid transporter AVT1I-like n=1 Tax=Euphorbia lathyris TaxID=212925 RepID=UPI00331356F4